MPQTLRRPEHFKVKDPTHNCSEVGSEEISTPTPEHNLSTPEHEILTIRAIRLGCIFSP